MPIEPRVVGERDQGVRARVEGADGDDERQQPRGRARHGAGPGRARTRTAVTRAEPRGSRRPGGALLCRLAEPDDEQPEAEGGDQRQADARSNAADRTPPGSRETRTIPASARPIPTHCQALGERPRKTSTTSGTTGEVAEMGATIPIAPTAMPR